MTNKYLDKILENGAESLYKEAKEKRHPAIPYLEAAEAGATGALASRAISPAVAHLANIPINREVQSRGTRYGISNHVINSFGKKHGLNIHEPGLADEMMHFGGPGIGFARSESMKEGADDILKAKKWKDFVFLGRRATKNNAAWMHELGHAKDLSSNSGAKLKAMQLARTMRHPLHSTIVGAALGSNEKTEGIAPYVGAAMGLPTMHEEFKANKNAYMHLKDVKGFKTANRFALGLAAKNMLGYAGATMAPGAISALSAKSMARLIRQQSEKRSNPTPSKLKSK